EYHLDFTINVEDWTDEGSIDDYEPGGNVDADGLVFTNTSAGDITYDADTRTVTIGITGTEQFTLTGASTSGYFVTMYYENGDQDNQWLEVTPAPDYVQTKADDNSKIEYTIKLVEHYVGKYPVATLRFTDKITAKESIVIVQPLAKPTVSMISQSAEGSFDDETNTCVLAQTTSVADPYVQFKVFASGGSKMKFEAGYDIPNWLEVTPSADQSDPISNYKLTVNTSAANFPYPFPDAGKTIEFVNKANADMNQSIIVKMQSYLSVTGTTSSGSNYTSSSNTITFTPTLATTTSPYITLNVQATRGSKLTSTDFSAGSQQWIVVDQGMEQNNYSSSYKITLNALANDFPTDDISDKTFEVENKLDGKTKIPVTIKLVTSAPEFKSATPTNASSGAFSFYNGSARNIHLFDDGSSVKLTVFSLGGCSVANKPAWVEVTSPSKSNCMEFTFKITGTADENATGDIVLTNSAGSLSIPVYARKKDIRLSGFATNNSYTSTSNIAASRPSITYYPSQKNYFTFKVRSPFGISASDNINWINYPDITETVTQSNGDKIQTIKVTQYNSISASTSNTRRKIGTITLTGTTTAIKKYIDLKTEHMTCNDIATTEPPKEIHTNYGRYWMTQSLDWAKAGQYESYKNRCPEGWKLLSAPEMTYLFAGRSISHPGRGEIYYYNNSTDRSYAASKVGYTIVSGRPGWFFVPNESSENAFTLGVASGNNGCDLRCWRAYNGSTDN
ncbi:hypothetical protein AALM74_26360, partial [Parabacteroides segnis]